MLVSIIRIQCIMDTAVVSTLYGAVGVEDNETLQQVPEHATLLSPHPPDLRAKGEGMHPGRIPRSRTRD